MLMKHRVSIYALIVFTLLSVVIWRNGQSDFNNVQWEQYVVGSGDTLWSIAKMSNVEEDTRDIIAVMQDHNDMKSVDLHPGDVVLYPVSK
ncbi:LysM peptidoglycan-binding domain-containing protein [Paenibacillus montanisoli]|nr:LysM peptidoglycan-binding domain-containing protein [Paenibacillus montanisoli]